MQIKNYKNLLEKVEKVIKQKELDLSSGEDLSIGVMNLISIEEHLFFTSQKTKDKKYLDILNEVRKVRTELLKEIIHDYEGEVWCFPGDTVIFGNPGPKKISDFTTKDKALSYDGSFQSVEKVYERKYKGQLISIYPYYSDPLKVTPGHEILCATDVRKKQRDLWRKNFTLPDVVWKKAENIIDEDFLLFPRYTETEDLENISINYTWTNNGCYKPTTFSKNIKIKVNNDLLKLIGLYISEGSASYRRYTYKNSYKTNRNVYFSFGKHETDLIKKTQSLFKKVFKIPLKVSETKTTLDLTCSRRVVYKFFSQFGCRCKEKEIPSWILKLPEKKLYSLLWGLIKGDGWVDKYQISYFTSSEKLSFQLRILLYKLGIIHSLKKRVTKGGIISGRKIKSSVGYQIGISGDAARLINDNTQLKYRVKKTSGNFGYMLDDYVMIPIRKIKRDDYSGLVYNLQTKSHTYTTFTGVVHNCISKHLLAASMRIMEVGTKELNKGKKEKAMDLFKKSYDLYALFWALNLGSVKVKDIKKKDDTEIEFIDEDKNKGTMTSVFEKAGVLINKVLDCCRE